MGGSSNPIKKIKKVAKTAVKKTVAQVKRTKAEDAFSMGGSLVNRFIQDKTGVKGAGLFTSGGIARKIGGEAGEKFVDKPKEAKAEFQRQSAEAERAQKSQLSQLKKRRAQEKAEAGASEALEKGRRKQQRRRKSQGRRSTILTGKVGGVGGAAAEGQKDILGG